MPSPVASAPAADLHLRSYRVDAWVHSHDYAQLVLPLAGPVELEILGRGGRVAAGGVAFVEPGASHATSAPGDNQSLILDLPPAWLPEQFMEQWATRPFMALPQAAGKLVDFMGLMMQQQHAIALSQLQYWVPLLLDSLALQAPRPSSRLQLLLARIAAEPGLPWSVADMASAASISASRLHEWFRQETGSSPRAWLAEARVQRACSLLRESALPLAQVAQRCGYSDQSALSHAMRKLRQTTPAAYRRGADPAIIHTMN